MRKIISMIIPVYKTRDFVLRCLTSLVNQNIRSEDYEILVIIDGSPDDSLEVVTNFSKKYNNIRIINQKNKGLSETRNIGIKNIQSKYVWFIDSDDWISENCLLTLTDIMSKKNLDMFGVAPSIPYQSDFKNSFHEKDSLSSITTGQERLLNNDYVIGACCYIFRTQFLLDNDLWFMRNVYFEDEEFTPKALFYAQKVMMLTNFSVYSYFIREGSITSSFSEKSINDKLLVATSLYSFSTGAQITSDDIRIVFKRRATNIVLSGINEIKNNKLGIKYLKSYLYQVKKAGLYPFQTKNTTLKSKLLLNAWNQFPKLCYKIKF